MENLLIATSIVAITELTVRLRKKDIAGVVTIISAPIIGALVGYANIQDMTVFTGILAGFNAVGIHAVAKQIGKK